MSRRKQHEKELAQELLRRNERVLEHIAQELEGINCALEAILSYVRPHRLTHSVANIFTGDSNMANNALVFNVGQTSIDTPTGFLADGVTPSGGVVSNLAVTFSDPSATAVINADGVTITFTGVAASNGPVSGSTSFTITDTDGVVSQWVQPFTVTTNAVPPPPAQLTQSVANMFSTPTP